MVKLRLKRFGRRHRPYFRLNAIDQRKSRDGLSIEELGSFDPIESDESKQLKINTERVQYWLSVGAQPSQTVAARLKRAGLDPTPGKSA